MLQVTLTAACGKAETMSSSASEDSSTAFVSSSTNSGTPSVRSAISSTISGGSTMCPATFATIAAVLRRSSRDSVSIVTCGCPVHGWMKFSPGRSYQEHSPIQHPLYHAVQ